MAAVPCFGGSAAAILERNTDIARTLATARLVAVTGSWDRLRSDSAFHAVLWVSEWPLSQVYPGFLAPVLLSSGIQRSFSLVCTPIRSDQAARDIRKKKTELNSDAAQRQEMGRIEDASQTAEYGDVLPQEADLTAGHGVLRYTGLISVSAPTPEELDTAVAAIEQAAIQASCETRRLVGQQAQAFTVAACRCAAPSDRVDARFEGGARWGISLRRGFLIRLQLFDTTTSAIIDPRNSHAPVFSSRSVFVVHDG
ncbi:SCO6880 family protein [Propionibacterium cyclohexanicum]|uniref:SCO6880 family protein n=1 Tax=Propionibacterium cyclohexanicum TaxID=64702 RepID=UPI001FE02769